MLLVVWVVNLIIKGPFRIIGTHDIICFDEFKRVWILENQIEGAIAGISDHYLPSLSLVLLVDLEHLSLLGSHLVSGQAWCFDLHGGSEVLLSAALRVNGINPVKLVLSQHDPLRLILVLVVNERRINVVSPARIPPPDSDGLWVGDSTRGQRHLIEAQLAGVVTRYVETILTSCWCLEVAVPDLTHLVGVVRWLLEHELQRLFDHGP